MWCSHPSLLAVGCLFQPSCQGSEGEVPEEPWFLTAGQSALYPPGQPGAPRMFPGDAVWAASGPRGRVSPGTTHCSAVILCRGLSAMVYKSMFYVHIIMSTPSHYVSFLYSFSVWTLRKWKISHLSESAVLSQCWALLRTPCTRTPWCTTSCVCCCSSLMPAPSWQTSS